MGWVLEETNLKEVNLLDIAMAKQLLEFPVTRNFPKRYPKLRQKLTKNVFHCLPIFKKSDFKKILIELSSNSVF